MNFLAHDYHAFFAFKGRCRRCSCAVIYDMHRRMPDEFCAKCGAALDDIGAISIERAVELIANNRQTTTNQEKRT